jgi:hypothetical protein
MNKIIKIFQKKTVSSHSYATFILLLFTSDTQLNSKIKLKKYEHEIFKFKIKGKYILLII